MKTKTYKITIAYDRYTGYAVQLSEYWFTVPILNYKWWILLLIKRAKTRTSIDYYIRMWKKEFNVVEVENKTGDASFN